VILYLVRHGIAEDIGPDGDDRSRRLTERGRDRMASAAAGLRTLGIVPDVVLASPYPRATETAEIIAAALGAPAPETLDALTPDIAAADTVKAVGRHARHEQVMLVGHQPNLGEVGSLLLTGSPNGAILEVKKGSCMAFEVVGAMMRGGAVLRWLLPPAVLRGLGGG
jgi:phosphohistidine phosphatase